MDPAVIARDILDPVVAIACTKMTQFDSVLPQAQPATQAFAQTSVQTPCTAVPVTLL
jgi:hypothetical protein